MRQSFPRNGLPEPPEGSAPHARGQKGSKEGHMGTIQVFVVLSWAAFALRQILLKPVRALVTKDSNLR